MSPWICAVYFGVANYIATFVDLFPSVEREMDMSSDNYDVSKYDPPPAVQATKVKRPHFFVSNGHPIYPSIQFVILSANMKVIMTHSIVLSQFFYYFFTASLGSCYSHPVTCITFSDVFLATLHVLRRIKEPPDKLWTLLRNILGQCIHLIAASVHRLPLLVCLLLGDSQWTWNNVYTTAWNFVYARTSPTHGYQRLRRGRLLALQIMILGLPLVLATSPFYLSSKHTLDMIQSLLIHDDEMNQPVSPTIDLRDLLCDDFDDFELFHHLPIDSRDDPTVNCPPGEMCPCHSTLHSDIHSYQCMPINSTDASSTCDASRPKAFCATTSPATTDQPSQTRITDNTSPPKCYLKRYKTFLDRASSVIDDTNFEPGLIDIVVDSGATSTSVANKAEFVSLTETTNDNIELDGIAAGLKIAGEGIVEYEITADSGNTFIARSHAYWVPGLPENTRLFSPQSFNTNTGLRGTAACHSNRKPDGTIEPGGFAEIFTKPDGPNWQRSDPVHVVTVPYDSQTNLPSLRVRLPGDRDRSRRCLAGALCVTEQANANLTNAQKELLKLHFRLGHIGFAHLQWMVRHKRVLIRHQDAVAKCDIRGLKCAACEFGKATRRPTQTESSQKIPSKEMEIRKGDLFPGQRVSVDHYHCKEPGRTYQSRGSKRTNQKYCGGLLATDHASGYISIHHQVTFSAADTIEAKLKLERDAASDGVIIQGYHTDHGVFDSRAFMKEIASSKQDLRFSAAGAAHANGCSERSIQHITRMARTMMLHAALRSPPDTITADMWTFSMDYSVWIWNRIPRRDTGLSSLELWTRSVSEISRQSLADTHVWGCAAYVLEPKLQKGGVKIPKWMPRSRRGVFVGFSPKHSSLVGLVLNLSSKAVTSCFHLVFDDLFSTVHCNDDEPPKAWNELVTSRFSRVQHHTDDDIEYPLDEVWTEHDTRASGDNERRRSAVIVAQQRSEQTTVEREDEPTRQPSTPDPAPDPQLRTDSPTQPQRESPTVPQTPPNRIRFRDNISRLIFDPDSMPLHTNRTPDPVSTPVASPISNLRRSSRTSKPVDRYTDDSFGPHSQWKTSNVKAMAAVLTSYHWKPDEWTRISALLATIDRESVIDKVQPHAFAATQHTKNPDLPTYAEAMCGDHAEEYWEAMRKEIANLVKRNVWEVVPRSSIPEGVKTVPGTWSYRCKRRPSGDFLKFKARWCLRGDIMKRNIIDSGETVDNFSPVCQWSSIRLMMVMGIIFGLDSKAVDFSNAFAQAALPEDQPVYAELPKNFVTCDGSDSILKMKHSLYGSSFASKLWFEKLSEGLQKRGFRPSRIDPCMFVSKTMVICSYIDDLACWYSSEEDFKQLIKSFEDDGDEYNWELTVDSSLGEYLGIEMTTLPDGGIQLTQKGLIDRILTTTKMSDCKGKASPTDGSGKPLGSDKEGAPASASWSYPSVIGMLLYLASNSRPDIAYATHMAARYTHEPKASHEAAVIRICRYLQHTKNDGMILRPTKSLELALYTDADFAGHYGTSTEDPHDPITAKSRAGYIITFAGCPIVFVSKLINEVCLSTLEAEFVAYSTGMRCLLPMKEVLSHFVKHFDCSVKDVRYVIKTNAFIDNSGACQLAQSKRLTPRTRYMAAKYFWFLDKVWAKEVIPEKIDGKIQQADIMTKNTDEATFLRLRQLICGW